ncbi:MAG TPA: sigma-70 family RNA polymerase sigma factor [Pirellulales bacterium]|nr:sigma-70 family RNA polymerase sigma factor [Pirellulales bacterium]
MRHDFNTLVDSHGRAVYAAAWRILGHQADTQDVVQEVFLEAFQRFADERIEHWPALLRRLATYRALDRLRQRRPMTPLEGWAVADPGEEPWAVAAERELAERLREAVAQLPQREASVFCLSSFDGLSNSQIAEVLQISSGAVAVALHKARGKLATRLAQITTGE